MADSPDPTETKLPRIQNSPLHRVYSSRICPSRNSPSSPLSDLKSSSVVSSDNSATKSSSELETTTFAFSGNNYFTGKRVRKFKKKKDRSRSNVSLKKCLENKSDSEGENKASIKDVSIVNAERILEYNLQCGKDLTPGVSRPDIYTDFTETNPPSSVIRSIRSIDSTRKQYEVVSQGVQTDWSWLRYKALDDNNNEELRDPEEISEIIKSGLYGGIDSTNRENSDREKHSGKKGKAEHTHDNTTSTNKEPQVNEFLNIDDTPGKVLKEKRSKSVCGSKKEKDPCEKKRNVKSARLNRYSQHNDLSGQTSQTNGLPEILRYQREKLDIKKQKTPTLEWNKVPDKIDAPRDGPVGLFSGLCQFCDKLIIPIPATENLKDLDTLDQLYCCPEYEHFIKLHMAFEEEEHNFDDEIIDIMPHAPYGSKVNRKARTDRAAERTRERELERQRAAAQQANLFSFARQMKTIQFSLTSTRCMADGWAVKPPSPLPEEPPDDEDNFKVEVNSTLLQKSQVMNEKYYDNGQRFLTIFPDGTGCCYYPSGNVAVIITSTEPEKYTYIVQTNKSYDNLEDSGILAVFEPNGSGICYFQKKRKLKLFINAHGGIELDRHGCKRQRWKWYFVDGQSKTPAFQPLCFPLNKYLSVRLLDQDNIALIFSSNRRSVRFNVGSNLKTLKIKGHGTFEADESEGYLTTKKRRISKALTNLHNALRLPKSTRYDRIYLPRLTKKEKKAQTTLPVMNGDKNIVVN